MKILNFGSLNIDHVYGVDHFVRPGETLASKRYQRFSGGKGNNQSIALARAGAPVWHAGKIGADGVWLLALLRQAGANTSLVARGTTPTGHAIIQVQKDGENCIVLYGGANQTITPADAKAVLVRFRAGDYLLLQNEISSIPAIMRLAARRKMKIVFNPAPMSRRVRQYPLKLVDIFIVNEIEGAELTGEKGAHRILAAMRRCYPQAVVILTLGARGAICAHATGSVQVPGRKVKAVDTTAAGDTFIGYFLAAYTQSGNVSKALQIACKAAAICVTRPGAADSIPCRKEVAE